MNSTLRDHADWAARLVLVLTLISSMFIGFVQFGGPASPVQPTEATTTEETGFGSGESVRYQHAIVIGDYLYVHDDDTAREIDIWDISNRTNPSYVTSLSGPDGFYVKFETKGDYLYALDGADSRMQVIDVSEPSSPTVDNTISTNGEGVAELSPSGDYLALGGTGGSVSIYDVTDPSAPSKISNVTIDQVRGLEWGANGNHIYAGGKDSSGNGGLVSIDTASKTSPSIISTLPADTPQSVQRVGNGYLLVGDDLGTNIRLVDASDPSSMSTVDTIDTVGDQAIVPLGDDKYATISDNSNYGQAFNILSVDNVAGTISVVESKDVSGNSLAVVSGIIYLTGDNGVSVYSTDQTSFTKAVKFTVKTLEGEPVADAKAEVWGVDHSQITTESGETKQQRAEELLDQAQNPKPPSWDPAYDLVNNVESTEKSYVAVHTEEDWGESTFVPSVDDPALGEPVLQVEKGQPVALSVWNAGNEGLYENAVDSDLPGATVKEPTNLTITKVGPSGDEISMKEVTTSEYKQTGTVINEQQHHAYVTELPRGFYVVENADAEGPTQPYTIVVGDPDGLAATFAENLRTRAGALSERAQEIQDRKSNGTFVTKTVVTDSNGQATVDVGSSVKTVDIVAYKHSFDDLQPSADLDQIRTEYESLAEQNETAPPALYISEEPTRVSPPASGVDVDVRKIDAPTFQDLGDALSNFAALEDFIDSSSWAGLEAPTPQGLDDGLNSTEADELRDQYEKLQNQNQDLQETVNDLLEARNETADQLTPEEYSALVKTAVEETADEFETGETTKELTEGESGQQLVDMTIPVTEGDPEEAVVIARLSDGTVDKLSEDEYSVESSSLPGFDSEIVISDYELPEGVNAVNFDVSMASSDSVGSTDVQVTNPALGNVPNVDAIDISTTQPSTGEPVSVEVESEDTAFRGVSEVRAIAPDGTTTTASLSDGEATFTPQQQGTYIVETDIQNADGETITETTRIPVGERTYDWPTGVRVSSGVTGQYVVAMDNVDDATFEDQGERAIVSMRVEDSNTGRIAVHAADAIDAADKDVTVRVLGQDGQQLDGYRSVSIYTARMDENALVYRGGQPVADGLRYGNVTQQGDATVIKTYTGQNGEVDISVNSNPSFVDEAWYEGQVIIEKYSPSLSVGGGGLLGGIVLILFRREAGDDDA